MPYAIRVKTGLEEGELYPLFENREMVSTWDALRAEIGTNRVRKSRLIAGKFVG